MSTQPQGDQRKFEIGLAMAGAVSAGAYTAGVMDFLIQALDTWHARKDVERSSHGEHLREWTVPPHDVEIKTMAGASAGAMTAALTAVSLCENHTPVVSPVPEGKVLPNRLYTSWVEEIDAFKLLEFPKKREKHVRSLLNSDVLDIIAKRGTVYEWRGSRRPYVSDGMSLFICVTNLRGVPYSISLQGEAGTEHQMTSHADHIKFTLGGVEAGGTDRLRQPATRIEPDQPLTAGWTKLADAALASGAFPVALASRVLERKPEDYENRLWVIPRDEPEDVDGEASCQTIQHIKPIWEARRPDPYRFLCVDAGVMNNEPLELARQALAGIGRNERDGKAADRAVVMIDPFPSRADFDSDYVPQTGITSVLHRLFSSLNAQANFKPEELKLAQDPNVFSRFVIAPTRYEQTSAEPQLAEAALAAGSLSNFGGFLAREFREHDFFLGRRNCQQFLRRHFVLPADNPLFEGWSSTLKDHYGIERDGATMLPIIPLMDEADAEAPARPWPTINESDLAALTPLLRRRVNTLVGAALSVVPPWCYWPGWPIWRGIRYYAVRRIVRWVSTTVRRTLKERGLLR